MRTRARAHTMNTLTHVLLRLIEFLSGRHRLCGVRVAGRYVVLRLGTQKVTDLATHARRTPRRSRRQTSSAFGATDAVAVRVVEVTRRHRSVYVWRGHQLAFLQLEFIGGNRLALLLQRGFRLFRVVTSLLLVGARIVAREGARPLGEREHGVLFPVHVPGRCGVNFLLHQCHLFRRFEHTKLYTQSWPVERHHVHIHTLMTVHVRHSASTL